MKLGLTVGRGGSINAALFALTHDWDASLFWVQFQAFQKLRNRVSQLRSGRFHLEGSIGRTYLLDNASHAAIAV